MDYPKLRQMKNELLKNSSRTPEEDELLKELISLSEIIDKVKFSLAMSSDRCPTCGRPL